MNNFSTHRRAVIWMMTGCLLISACQPASQPPPSAPPIQSDPAQKRADGFASVSYEIIPDAELVRCSQAVGFSVENALKNAGGELIDYSETVGANLYSAADLIERVSRDYSVNARILLAVIEYRSGWLSAARRTPADDPLVLGKPGAFFTQLNWLADELNRGFYACRVGAVKTLTTNDGKLVERPGILNCASAAVQYLFSLTEDYTNWQLAVGPLGVQAVFLRLFGSSYLSAPQTQPPGTQPSLRLPFERGQTWYFTSGPHSAWGSGAAWAALDFAPAEGQLYCYQSDAWITAAADGVVARSEDGGVVLDLDGDGLEETGWTLFYMHIATRDRVPLGEHLKTGDRIGHPSCEGGPSSGTHMHLARRYNGEWIPADQDLPFNLDGWISGGSGAEYDGSLSRGGIVITALGFPADANQITP